MDKRKYQMCSVTVMDTTDSKITFNEKGESDYVTNFRENILPSWNYGLNKEEELDNLVKKIKKDGRNKKYDCIIGISGGVDSSYLLYYAVTKLKLRPLVYSVDTGWNTETANNNIRKLVEKLGLEIIVDKVNTKEMYDLQLSFFKAQVPYQDLPQDHVIFAGLYNTAVKHKIKHVLTGGNYSAECAREPNEWVYMNDLKFIKDVHKKHGTIKLKTLPMTSMFKYRLYYRYFKGMKVHRPLDMIPYIQEDVVNELKEVFNWEPYANKHYESILTRFYEGYWLYEKFGYDKRKAYYSSLILTGQMKRREALEKLKQRPYPLEDAMEDLEKICKNLNIKKEHFFNLMKMSNNTYEDYKNSYWKINLAIKIAKFIGIEKRQFR